MAATAFPAAAIVSGTIATPRLGSGTADATSFLRGDSTWAVVPEVTRASLGLATTDSPTFAGATFNTGTITTSQPLSLSQTWNNAATTFTGLQVNATDTASNAASLLMDLQVGGSSKFNVKKNGALSTQQIADFFNFRFSVTQFGVGLESVGYYGISSSGSSAGTHDVRIYRDAANTLAQRNGTNGQKSRIYKTYTSATSGEWLEFDAATDASNFDIAASIGSAGGTARGIRIGGKDAAGTFTPWMSFSTAGAATFGGTINSPKVVATIVETGHVFATSSNGTQGLQFSGSETYINIINNKKLRIRNSVGFVEVASIDSSGSAIFSGTLQIGNAAVAETPVATHTLIIKDSTGTSYRVLAVAV